VTITRAPAGTVRFQEPCCAAGDTNLGYQTFLNGTRVSTIVVDTGQAVTNSIDYVGTSLSFPEIISGRIRAPIRQVQSFRRGLRALTPRLFGIRRLGRLSDGESSFQQKPLFWSCRIALHKAYLITGS
jgi:hypothetical protein